jgi:hypothetical protein
MFWKIFRNIFVLGVFICVFPAIHTNAQTESDMLLNRRLTNVSVKGDTLHKVLSEIASSHGIPIGYEYIISKSPPCELKNSLSLQFNWILVKDLITLLMSETVNCDWQVIDNVINVFAQSGKSPLSETIIHRLEIPKGLSKQGIKEIIIESPEVKSVLSSNKLRLTTLFTSLSETKPVSENFSLSVRDVPLRYVLDEIAKNSRSKYWSLSNWRRNQEAIFLSF